MHVADQVEVLSFLVLGLLTVPTITSALHLVASLSLVYCVAYSVSRSFRSVAPALMARKFPRYAGRMELHRYAGTLTLLHAPYSWYMLIFNRQATPFDKSCYHFCWVLAVGNLVTGLVLLPKLSTKAGPILIQMFVAGTALVAGSHSIALVSFLRSNGCPPAALHSITLVAVAVNLLGSGFSVISLLWRAHRWLTGNATRLGACRQEHVAERKEHNWRGLLYTIWLRPESYAAPADDERNTPDSLLMDVTIVLTSVLPSFPMVLAVYNIGMARADSAIANLSHHPHALSALTFYAALQICAVGPANMFDATLMMLGRSGHMSPNRMFTEIALSMTLCLVAPRILVTCVLSEEDLTAYTNAEAEYYWPIVGR